LARGFAGGRRQVNPARALDVLIAALHGPRRKPKTELGGAMADYISISDPDDAMAVALQRLEQVVGALERAVLAKIDAGQTPEPDLFKDDRGHLSAELAAARAREKALEQVAAEASAALGRAAAEVRAALSAEER
jgi:hypothetical protein